MSRTRALANRERDRQILKLVSISKSALLSIATFMTFATVALLVIDKLYHPQSFEIEQIKLKGNFQFVQPDEVQAVVFEQPLGNYFSVSLADIKRRIELVPWIQSVDVRREWPDSLMVKIVEHRPVSEWRDVENIGDSDGKKLWVTATGRIVEVEEAKVRNSPFLLRGVERDSKRLLLKALKWKTELAASGIEVQEVALSASQSWKLKLNYFGQKQNFDLLLGRENVDMRMARFQMLYDSHFRNSAERLVRVDARYPDGVAVKSEESKIEDDSHGSEENQNS